MSTSGTDTDGSESDWAGLNYRAIGFIASLLAIGVAACYYTFDPKLFLGGDNVNYYLLGQALAEGRGFVRIWIPDMPAGYHFPPGYPLILAAVRLVFGPSIAAAKMANAAFFLGSLVILYLLLRRFGLDRVVAFVVTAVVAVNAHLLEYATIMMSEIPFLFFVTLGFYLLSRLNFEVPPYRNPQLYGLLLSLGCAYYIRAVGIAAVFGVLVYMALRRQWLYAGVMSGGMIAIGLPWFLRGLGRSTYLHQLIQVNPYRPSLGTIGPLDLVSRFGENLLRYVTVEIPKGCLPLLDLPARAPTVIGTVFGLLLLGLILYGIWKLPRYHTLLGGYLVGMFGILLLWPEVWYGVRFLIPLLPVFLFLAVYGLYHALQEMLRQAGMRTELNPFLLLVLLFVYYPSMERLNQTANQPYPPNWSNYFQLAQWAGNNIPGDAVVAARKPTFFYVYSGRQTVRYAYTKKADQLLAELNDDGVSHVVVESLGFGQTARFLVPAIRKHSSQFRIIHQLDNPTTVLLQYVAASGTVP